MSITDIIKSFVSAFVKSSVGSVATSLESKLPGLLAGLIEQALQSTTIWAKITEWENKGITALEEFFIHGAQELKNLVLSHVHGALGEAIAAGVSAAEGGVLHLTATQVRQATALQAANAGALDEALAYEFAKLGITPPK